MGIPNVTVNQINGTSGRPLPGFDHYSSLIFYGSAPSVSGKWQEYPGPPIIKAQQLFSIDDAFSAGIIPYSDNIAPSGTYTITTQGNTGDLIEIQITLPSVSGNRILSLGVYKVLAGENTTALQATAIKNLINSGTVNHGFSATVSGSAVTIYAPTTVGKSLNSGTPIGVIITGAAAGTIVQFSNGTTSKHAIWFYHIKEYFKRHNKGVLWVGFIAASSSFNEISSIQSASSNKIRQVGIYDDSASRGSAANITGTITSLDIACDKLDDSSPLIAIYSPNIFGVSDLSVYPDQNLNVANKVQCVISQDGGNEGAQLFIHAQQSIGNVGSKIGTISASRVSASDAQAIDLFNNSDGIENDITAFSNGQLSSSVNFGLQTQLANYNYTFFRKFGDTKVGSYWIDNKMCVNRKSLYANVNDNRVSQKVKRIMYTTFVPELNGEIFFTEDGLMQDYYIEYLVDLGSDAIDADMVTGFGNAPLLSGYTISIDPTQKVKQTDNLVINVEIVSNGVARNITINVAYKVN